MLSNISRCIKCGLQVISEEFQIHQCKKVIDYKIEGNILWVFDGRRWIPRKISPPKNKHSSSTPDDETEPTFCIFMIYSIHAMTESYQTLIITSSNKRNPIGKTLAQMDGEKNISKGKAHILMEDLKNKIRIPKLRYGIKFYNALFASPYFKGFLHPIK